MQEKLGAGFKTFFNTTQFNSSRKYVSLNLWMHAAQEFISGMNCLTGLLDWHLIQKPINQWASSWCWV